MKFHRLSHCARSAVVLGLLLVCTAVATAKPIRLRTELITPPSQAASPQTATVAEPPTSGLFLVQFTGALAPVQREQLSALGVELLRYVPEDAFIARFRSAKPGQVRALSFVTFVGHYRPDHKVHPRLTAAARKAAETNQLVTVNILVAPGTAPHELASVRGLLSSLVHESSLRQGTFLRATLAPNRLDALAQSSAVLWLEPAPTRKLVDEQASKLVGGDDGALATPTVTQQLGFTGAGVTVCVADTGLDTGNTNTMHPDLRGRVTAFHNYGLPDGSDGYGHGTHVAGIVAGNAATGETDPDTGTLYGLGVASQANLVIERIFDDNAGMVAPFPSDETLTHDGLRSGAQIGANSWGNDVQGEYDTDAAQFDELVRDADSGTTGDQPYILEFSAGNAGPGTQTIGSPATGKNVLATGASENALNSPAMNYGLYSDGPDTMADFSSRGPCEDGRIKPDVVTPGSWIASLASSAALDLASVSWLPIDNYYVYMGGTSMSGPAAAGAAAVFVQYYKSLHTNALPSPALVKAALINSAEQLDLLNGGPGPIPNNDEGWGRITLTNIIVTNLNSAPRYYEYVDQSVPLTNGQLYVRHALVQNSDQPLKITLAYTDVPGFPGAIPALVNDLDLEVLGPDGTLYRGNQFAGYDSVPNAPATDKLNNVEAVHLSHPTPGDYQVRVRARNVVQDARLSTSAIEQDFALVVSGNLARPGAGFVLLDRPTYTAPGSLQVTAMDPGRAASNSVSVLVKSTTEPAGENYLLRSAGSYGVFTGTVATVAGNAATDGKLQLHNGDAIEADYLDQSGTLRVATATADLVPPTISGVTISVDMGLNTITWQTSEPANSVLHYSTDLSFNLTAANGDFTTAHSLRLPKLLPGQTYYFYLTSTDPAGNTVTHNNNGAWFSFVAVAPPTVLLVDAYDPVTDSPEIPDSAYTNALAAAGFRFAHWKVSQRGSPQLADLQAFPAVVWRAVDDIINYGVDEEGFPDPTATNNTLNAQQQLMLENYLAGGGSLFMSSMSMLTQVGNVPFRKNVFQVAGFEPNPDPPSPCTECDEDFGVPALVGAPGSPITGGMSLLLDYTNYPSLDLSADWGEPMFYGPDFSDTFTPSSEATAIAFEAVSGKPCGMAFPRVGIDHPGRVVFLSFPLDAVPDNGVWPNNETVLLRNILNFLVPGANGQGTLFLNNSVYSLPDQVIVEMGDTDLVGIGQAQATAWASSAPGTRVTVTLNETTHPGLFRGYLTLSATNSSATNRLLARAGDTITVSYFDASNNSNVLATATVDTTPPVISQVAAASSFGNAVVSWTTSEPADSLVQYGESTLLGQTVYESKLVTNHVLTITGLMANRDYYYQVVSRDAAGNTAVDDNHGSNYVLTTQRAPRPPWSDNLDSGAAGWTVVADPSYPGLQWTLGTPNNSLQTSAHSGANAWGSDLDGQDIPLVAHSFLVSPVIDLSAMSEATLTFWDCFDFSAVFEQGQMRIITSIGTPPASAAVLQDFSGAAAFGWEQESIPLTPYVGKSIQLVWEYEGVMLTAPGGWLIDDVAITGTAAGGTIVVSKNLSQGNFTLTGPIGQKSSATLTVITNAPPGAYSVAFDPVTDYQQPAAQTNTLAIGGTITFTGTYDFIDANHNGISDAWEREYFGSVSTNRTQSTDTDGDGMTDYAEFIAGTDPTSAASKLMFLSSTVQTNKAVKLDWATQPGRLYQVETSTNLTTWAPVTDWLPYSGSPMSYTATNRTSGSHLYRVQVRP